MCPLAGRGIGVNTVLMTHFSVVTPLGNSMASLWQGLINGHTAIRPITRFDTQPYRSSIAAWMDLPVDNESGSALRALLTPLLESIGPLPPRTLLITATTKGGIDILEQVQWGHSAPSNLYLPSQATQVIADDLDISGGAFNVSAACTSGSTAVCQGAALIQTNMAEAVLICAFDLVSEFVFSGFSSLKILSSEPCRPFDQNRDGLTLGEGAAAILLMSPSAAQKEQRKRLGSVVGLGMTNDANHITSPSRSGEGLVRAIEKALTVADLRPEQIGAVCTHGTGTVYNDLMESKAIQQVFGLNGPPFFSVKGAMGHTLGAAGALEVCVATKALAEQRIPPTTGCREPEKGLEKMVSNGSVSFNADYILSVNSGFGGINTALILSR